jgi:PleD family two-component response regulator
MANRDFIEYHIEKALLGALAESVGNEDLSRRLNAQTKLRLITMSDEELLELARLTADSSDKTVKQVYKESKWWIEEHKATANEWINDLKKEWRLTGEERMSDRILIIGGEPALVWELTSALSKGGFEMASVPDYPRAVFKLLEFQPDMVIIDEVLPGGDGLDACFQIRTTFGIPVILLGKDDSDEKWLTVVDAGADLYLTKPLPQMELVARLKAILRRYKKTQEDRKK